MGKFDNAALIKGNVTGEIAKLKQGIGKDILVTGGPTLVESLLYADLLDEPTLMVHPVVAGKGKRLFKQDGALERIRLFNATTTSSGVAILTYQPLGDR